MTVGVLAAFSSGVSADFIPAVDAWGNGTSGTEQNQENYNHGCYGSAHCSQLIDGDRGAHAYPGSAKVGGTHTNLWFYVDLGADYVVDRVDLWGNSMDMHGMNMQMIISTAVDGADGGASPLWSLDTNSWTAEDIVVGAPFTLQKVGNANVEDWGQIGTWVAGSADEDGEEVSVSIPLDPVVARYVKIGSPQTGYGGFSLAEIEVYGTIPEPASAAVIGLGGILLMIRRRHS